MNSVFRVAVACLTLVGFGSASIADDAEKTYQACLDASSSDPDMIKCAYAAQDAWDKVLNENYQAAMAALAKPQQEALRKAQRAWLAYRDADKAFRDGDWQFGDAFDTKLSLAQAGVDVIKDRAQLLATYADSVTDGS